MGKNYQMRENVFVLPVDMENRSAESIARLKMVLICSKWGLDGGKPVIIRNIPISRD